MTTVAEFITYLQKLPPGTEIMVLEEYDDSWSTYTGFSHLDLDGYSGNFELFGNTLYLGRK